MWRRAQAAKTREERTITAFIKGKHPEVYHEAAAFYNELNRRYPSKNDLRKVPEFQSLTLNVPVQTTKYWKKEYPDINVALPFKDTLELRIPLLNKTAEDTPTPEPVQFCVVEEGTATTAEDTPTTTTTPTPEPVQFCVVEEGTVTTTTPEPVQLGDIDNDIIEKIIADLQKDADLQSIFDDMDLDEVSPLEHELLFW